MKVLKEGNVPSRNEFFRDAQVRCGPARDDHDRDGCGAELEFGEADLVPRYYEASHSNKYYFAVVCPRCGKDIFIEMPPVVLKELLTEEAKMNATFDGFSDR